MKRILSFVLIALIVALSGVAYGATSTSTLDVRTTIIPTCSVSTTPVYFGVHDGSTPVYANGDVTVTCASGTGYRIALDAGQAMFIFRSVTNVLGNGISYFLFKDGSWNDQWGDSDFTNTYPLGSSLADTGSGSAQPHTVEVDPNGWTVLGLN